MVACECCSLESGVNGEYLLRSFDGWSDGISQLAERAFEERWSVSFL